MIQTKHFKLPFNFVGQSAAEIEQDTAEDIAQGVEVVLRYPVGFRTERPDFGVTEQAFNQGGADVEEISASIALWEPRADAELEHNPDQYDELIDRVRVSLKGTDNG